MDGGLEDQALMAHCRARIDDARQKCKSQVSSKKIYEAWENVGLVFGPTFQTVAEPVVDHGTGVTLAKVKPTIPLLKTLMPREYLQPHLIHPTILDVLDHKIPSMKFLDVSNGNCAFTKDVLSTLGQRYAQYDFTDSSSSSLDEIRNSIPDDSVQFTVLDVGTQPSS